MGEVAEAGMKAALAAKPFSSKEFLKACESNEIAVSFFCPKPFYEFLSSM